VSDKPTAYDDFKRRFRDLLWGVSPHVLDDLRVWLDQLVAASNRQGGITDEQISKVYRNMGHVGGKKGGPARAKAMTPEQRHECAKKAARARWDRQKAAGGAK
jgi:hypothetical protein